MIILKLQKIVLISTTSMPITDNSNEEIMLKRILCIYFPVSFQKGQKPVEVLFNNSNDVNAISPAYVKKVDLKT